MKTNENPVGVHYGKDGTPDGILVQTLDDSFIINLHDAENGKGMTWDYAIEKYEDVMPDKQRALFICAYMEEINKLLKEVGGDRLDGWYWTKSEYSNYNAWFFNGGNGCVYYNYKCSSLSVRPVLASA